MEHERPGRGNVGPTSEKDTGGDSRSTANRGGGGSVAYKPPPELGGTGRKSKSGIWRYVAGAAAALTIGAAALMMRTAPNPPSTSSGYTEQVGQTLRAGNADVHRQATEYARTLIAARQKSDASLASAGSVHAGYDAHGAVTAPVVPRQTSPAASPDIAQPIDQHVQKAVEAIVERAPPETRIEILEGRKSIYALHVLDTAYEDGDIVTVRIGGVDFGQIALSNDGQDILVPLFAGSPTDVLVMADYDGGGGVTFGFSSSLGESRSRDMNVGESESWTVVVN